MSHHEHESADVHAVEAHDEHPAPPPPEEPKTPMWVTVVGVGLFVIAGIWFLATRPEGKTVDQLRVAVAASAPAASIQVAATPPAAANPPPPPRAAQPAPAGNCGN